MDPTTQEKIQNDSSQEKQPSGGIGNLIDVGNKLAGGDIRKNPTLKIIKSGVTIARGFWAFLAANPWVWAVLGIIILVVIVFVVVISGGAPGAPPPSESTPTTTPTETLTPAPVAP